MVGWKSVYAFSVEISVYYEARKWAGKNTVILYSRPKPMVTKRRMRIYMQEEREYFCVCFQLEYQIS